MTFCFLLLDAKVRLDIEGEQMCFTEESSQSGLGLQTQRTAEVSSRRI